MLHELAASSAHWNMFAWHHDHANIVLLAHAARIFQHSASAAFLFLQLLPVLDDVAETEILRKGGQNLLIVHHFIQSV